MAFLIIAFVLLLLIDLYAFQAVRTVFETTPIFRSPASIIYWSLSLMVYLALFVGMATYETASPGLKRLLTGMVICMGVAKLSMVSILLIDDVVRLAKWLPSLFYRGPEREVPAMTISRSEFLNRMALLTGGVMFGLFGWGMIRTAYNYQVRRQRLAFNRLPTSFSDLKIVQISDLHLGSFIDTDPIEHAVGMINDLQPDLIFFTGDLVNARAKEAEPFIGALSKLKAKHGVFSVMGNHDYDNYYRFESEEAALQNNIRFKQIHAECGWDLLDNEHRILEIGGAKIAIIGVENWGSSEHFPKRGDIAKAKLGTENADVKLLLSHDPSHWNYIVSREHHDIDVTFSGHTHGFQMGVEIPGLHIKWSPVQYVYKQWAGLYERGQQYLYVNRGLGFIGYHGRVGIRPEITVLEIGR